VGGEMSNLRDNARDLRKHMTDAERRLWSSLRHTQLGARFRRQAPISPYILRTLHASSQGSSSRSTAANMPSNAVTTAAAMIG